MTYNEIEGYLSEASAQSKYLSGLETKMADLNKKINAHKKVYNNLRDFTPNKDTVNSKINKLTTEYNKLKELHAKYSLGTGRSYKNPDPIAGHNDIRKNVADAFKSGNWSSGTKEDYEVIKAGKGAFKRDAGGPTRSKYTESIEDLILESVENDEITIEEATMLLDFLSED